MPAPNKGKSVIDFISKPKTAAALPSGSSVLSMQSIRPSPGALGKLTVDWSQTITLRPHETKGAEQMLKSLKNPPIGSLQGCQYMGKYGNDVTLRAFVMNQQPDLQLASVPGLEKVKRRAVKLLASQGEKHPLFLLNDEKANALVVDTIVRNLISDDTQHDLGPARILTLHLDRVFSDLEFGNSFAQNLEGALEEVQRMDGETILFIHGIPWLLNEELSEEANILQRHLKAMRCASFVTPHQGMEISESDAFKGCFECIAVPDAIVTGKRRNRLMAWILKTSKKVWHYIKGDGGTIRALALIFVSIILAVSSTSLVISLAMLSWFNSVVSFVLTHALLGWLYRLSRANSI